AAGQVRRGPDEVVRPGCGRGQERIHGGLGGGNDRKPVGPAPLIAVLDGGPGLLHRIVSGPAGGRPRHWVAAIARRVSIPTIPGTAAQARARTPSGVRLAIGCGTVRYRYPGAPRRSAMASALAENASVQMTTVGRPDCSRMIPSATADALQDPQSPTPTTTMSHPARRSSR